MSESMKEVPLIRRMFLKDLNEVTLMLVSLFSVFFNKKLTTDCPLLLSVLAGYEAVRANIDALCKYDFTMVIADEGTNFVRCFFKHFILILLVLAHRIKNPKSMTTKALHRFDTIYRYGLTGTAVSYPLFLSSLELS